MTRHGHELQESARRGRWAAWGLILLAALAAARCFQPVPIGWDAAEYVWAVESRLLPHSPYLGFWALGKLVSLALPTALGLSLLEVSAYLGIAALLPGLLRRSGLGGPAALLATAAFLSFPVCQRHAGYQEGYALLLFGILLSLWLCAARFPGHLLASGLAFALTTIVHYGALLVLPALLHRVFRAGRPEEGSRHRRLLVWLLPGAVLGPIFLFTVWQLFEPSAGAGLGFWRYFRGIDLWARSRTPAALARSLGRELGRLGDPAVAGVPLAWGGLVLPGLYAAARRPWDLLVPWVLFGAPYALIEGLIGRNVEQGLYMSYLALPIAVFAGLGLETLRGSLRGVAGPRATGLVVAGVLVLFGFGLRESRRLFPAAEIAGFDRQPAVVASRWIGSHLGPGVVVVEPPGTTNPNLMPALHHRRPILWYRGGYRWMEPFGPWTPVHPAFFRELSESRLAQEIRAGTSIVALDRDLERRFGAIRLEPWPAGAEAPPFELYRVGLAPSLRSAAGQ